MQMLLLAMVAIGCAGFESTEYSFLKGLSKEEIAQKYLGLRTTPFIDPFFKFLSSLETSIYEGPESFDWRKEMPECVLPIRDQGHCGSCWAHSASEVLSDRFCIASKGQIKEVFSPQQLVDCDMIDMGCNGGFLTNPFLYYATVGAQTEECYGPYTSGKTGGRSRSCIIKDWKCPVRKASITTLRWHTSVDSIKANLVAFGPINTGFTVYEDFMTYKGGIYEHKTGGILGGHAVKIVGFGEENGVGYWIVQNSWSSAWGENGYFRIKFGEGGINSGAVSIRPSL